MLFNISWVPGIIKQKHKKSSEQKQKPALTSDEKPESIFTVVEIEDLESPTLVASIRLPYRANPKNSVVLVRNHAYSTTEQHLHVVDVSKPYLPFYLTSLEFPDEIGKVIAYQNRLVVAADKEFHIIDISVPTKPVIQSTTKLPNNNEIKNIDIQNDHLYVLGEDNYSLYIFSLAYRQTRFVRSKKLGKRWWFLSPSAKPPNIQEFPYPTKVTHAYSSLHEPFLSERGFLQLHPGAHGIIRASTQFLVTNDTSTKANDLPIKPELLKKNSGGLVVIDIYFIDETRHAISSGPAAIYSCRYKYWGETFEKGKKTFIRQKPKISHAIVDGKMQQITLEPMIEKVEIDNKTYEGRITDFLLDGNLLYIVNEKGFLSICRFPSGKELSNGKREEYLSTTAMQANKPISIAVGKQHSYVLAIPSEK